MEKATQQHKLVMLGTSRCGTCYKVLCKTWGIYFTVGSEIIGAIEQYVISIAADDPKSAYNFMTIGFLLNMAPTVLSSLYCWSCATILSSVKASLHSNGFLGSSK